MQIDLLKCTVKLATKPILSNWKFWSNLHPNKFQIVDLFYLPMILKTWWHFPYYVNPHQSPIQIIHNLKVIVQFIFHLYFSYFTDSEIVVWVSLARQSNTRSGKYFEKGSMWHWNVPHEKRSDMVTLLSVFWRKYIFYDAQYEV